MQTIVGVALNAKKSVSSAGHYVTDAKFTVHDDVTFSINPFRRRSLVVVHVRKRVNRMLTANSLPYMFIKPALSRFSLMMNRTLSTMAQKQHMNDYVLAVVVYSGYDGETFEERFPTAQAVAQFCSKHTMHGLVKKWYPRVTARDVHVSVGNDAWDDGEPIDGDPRLVDISIVVDALAKPPNDIVVHVNAASD